MCLLTFNIDIIVESNATPRLPHRKAKWCWPETGRHRFREVERSRARALRWGGHFDEMGIAIIRQKFQQLKIEQARQKVLFLNGYTAQW